MGIFGTAHGWGAIHHTYTTMMKFGTVIPHVKKTQVIYELRDTLFEFSCH